MSVFKSLSEEMYRWAEDLFPICRSITGPGLLETLNYLKKIIPDMEIHNIQTGTKVYDWEIPKEWRIKDAYVKDSSGKKIIDFKKNNLHIVGYSIPINARMTLDELLPHLHSLPEIPEAIPYVTSYYSENWGFCINHRQYQSLNPDIYEVVIDSELIQGNLHYGELVIPGETAQEIFVSTYVCHPSMANNEISGPVVTTALARWVSSLSHRKFTYRFIFIPETIGSIAYLSKNIAHLKTNVVAGFNITCVGDNLTFSYMPTPTGDSLADKVAQYVLNTNEVEYKKYSFLTRGSDERQYCWPGVDLPVISIMRSKYGTYKEYHTSLDNLEFISGVGLMGALEAHMDCVKMLEANEVYLPVSLCEPNLGSRGLYPKTSTLQNKTSSRDLIDFMAYCDGRRSVLDVSIIMNKRVDYILQLLDTLKSAGLITKRAMQGMQII